MTSAAQPSAKPDPDVRYLLEQYRNDLMFGVRDEGSRQRRIEAIDAALAKLNGKETA